jgi:hypothetical protein
MKNSFKISYWVWLLSGIFVSCTFYSKEQQYPAIACSADTLQSVSFSKNVIPIFQQNCAVATCHTAAEHAGNLVLDSSIAYTALWQSGTGYIDTTNPSASLLYSQLVSSTTPMPPTGKLDDCAIKIILKWMQQKAKNN